jgi:hypothetical protein
MKKVIALSLLAAGLLLGISSCGSHEKCPAYSYADQLTEQPA